MMTIISYREAKKGQVSTKEHIYNKQEKTNTKLELNKNYLKENILMYFNNDTLVKQSYVRDGNNENLISQFDTKEKKIDAEARADYKQHKLKEREENPEKKIRTVLQTKNLKKEFGLFLGGDKNIGNKEEFEKKILSTVKKIMEKKGLEDKNIISISIHYDEKTPHCHIQYNDYSFKHHTTGAELQRIRTDKNASKQEIKEAYKKQLDNFSEFQDLAAEGMEMERGQKNSKQKNKSKFEFYREEVKNNPRILSVKNVVMTKVENEELKAENKRLKTEIDEKQESYYYQHQNIVQMRETVAELQNISKNSKELAELFEVLGLDKISKDINEVKKAIEEKPSFLASLKNIIDNFIHLLNVKQDEEMRVSLFEKFKTKEPKEPEPNLKEELTNNVDKSNYVRKNKDQMDIG